MKLTVAVQNLASKNSPEVIKRRYLNKLIGSLSNRETMWLRNYLGDIHDREFLDLSSVNIKEGLIRQLSMYDDYKEIAESSLSEMRYQLIPNKEFQWLIDGMRPQLYIYSLLYNGEFKQGIQFLPNEYSHDVMSCIFSMIDYSTFEGTPLALDSKLGLLNSLKEDWANLRKYDNYSEWLDEKNTKKTRWTADYLIKNGLNLESLSTVSDIEESRVLILASLDSIDYLQKTSEGELGLPSHRKLLIIDKMKKAWNTKKYRDAGKTKTPYHLPLTKETKRRLENMSRIKNRSETEMLDVLINSEYKLNFLDANGNEIHECFLYREQ